MPFFNIQDIAFYFYVSGRFLSEINLDFITNISASIKTTTQI